MNGNLEVKGGKRFEGEERMMGEAEMNRILVSSVFRYKFVRSIIKCLMFTVAVYYTTVCVQLLMWIRKTEKELVKDQQPERKKSVSQFMKWLSLSLSLSPVPLSPFPADFPLSLFQKERTPVLINTFTQLCC